MVNIRVSLLWLMLFLAAVAPVQAVDVRLERLAAWGNDGYRFIESGPHGLYGLTSHALDFLEIGEGGRPSVTGSVFLDDFPIQSLQADGEFLWIATTASVQLVQLGAAEVTPLLRHIPSVRTSIWAGDRARLVVQQRDRLRFYRVNDGGELLAERELAWPEAVTQLALHGDDLIVQGETQIYVLAFNDGNRENAQVLDVPESAAFAHGGLAVRGQTVFAVDQGNNNLASWVRSQNAWTTRTPVPISDSDDTVFVRHIDDHYIALGNDDDTVWLFEQRDNSEPLFVRSENGINHHDVLLLSTDRWFTGNAQGLQDWVGDVDGMVVSYRLEQGGDSGDLAIKGSVIYWVKGDAVWLFDRRDPFNLTPITTLQTGPVHQLRLVGNILAVVGDELNLYNVSNPVEPTLLSTLPISFRGVAIQDRLMVGTFYDHREDLGHLQLYNLSNAAQPRLLHEQMDHRLFLKGVALMGDQVFGLGVSDVHQWHWHAEAARLDKVAQVYTGVGHLELDNFIVRDGQVLVYWGNLLALDYDDNTPLRRTVNTWLPTGGINDLSGLAERDGWVAAGGKDLVIVDARTPHQLEQIGQLAMAGVTDVAWQGNLLFVSGGGSGRLEAVRLKRVAPPSYFPWISNSTDFPSELTVVNEGPLPQTLTFTAMLRHAPAKTITRTIPGDSARVWSVDALFPDHTGYSLKVASESQQVQAFLQRRDRQGSVVQPAVAEDQTGADLVFPAFQGAAALRALVVTPLTTQTSTLAARLQRLNAAGTVVGEDPILLEPAEPNVVILPAGDFRFRVAMEGGIPLIGEQFHFDADGRHASVLGWSAGADADMRGPLTVLHQWTNPEARPWRAMDAYSRRVALADSKSVKVLGIRLTGLYELATLEGFDDIRDLAWGGDSLVVADSKGLFFYDLDDFGNVTPLAQIEQANVIQVEASNFPNRMLMVGMEGSPSSYGNWDLYQWREPTELNLVNEGHYNLPQRFSYEDGFVTFFEGYNEMVTYDLRTGYDVSIVQRVHVLQLVDGVEHQAFYHGDQILWLYTGRGLFSLYAPWSSDLNHAASAFNTQFLARDVAVMEDAVLVADRDNGLKLVDVTNPFDLKTVAHHPDLKTNLVDADAGRMWAADQDTGDVRFMGRGLQQPQWHVPYLPTDQGPLRLDYHRQLDSRVFLDWTAGALDGSISTEQRVGAIDVDDLVRDHILSSVSFAAGMPTVAWLRGESLRWVPTVRDDELGSALMVPLFGEQTPRVTLKHDGVADEIVFTLYLADGVDVTETRSTNAAQATTFTLTEIFDTDVLAQAKALRLEASEGARFTAAVHLLQNGALSQLIPATRVR